MNYTVINILIGLTLLHIGATVGVLAMGFVNINSKTKKEADKDGMDLHT